MARTITSLPRWNPLGAILREAGLAPVHLLLDRMSQAYGLRVLCQEDDHPCKKPLIRLLSSRPTAETGTGLQRIAELLLPLADNALPLEDTSDNPPYILPVPEIETGKEETARAHKTWVPTLPPKTLLLYTDCYGA